MTRERSSEAGFTLIEVVVAMFAAVLIFGAVAVAMGDNNKSSLENQRQTQLLSVLQQQIEHVHQLFTQNYATVGFAGLALSSNPAQGSDSTLPVSPTDPNDFITPYVSNFVTATSGTAERFMIEKNYNSTGEAPSTAVRATRRNSRSIPPTARSRRSATSISPSERPISRSRAFPPAIRTRRSTRT